MSPEIYKSNFVKINKRNNSTGEIFFFKGFKTEMSFEVGFERW